MMPEIKVIVMVGIGKDDGKLYVQGNLADKPMCYKAIGEALKVITDYEPSPIVIPGVPVMGGNNGGRIPGGK